MGTLLLFAGIAEARRVEHKSRWAEKKARIAAYLEEKAINDANAAARAEEFAEARRGKIAAFIASKREKYASKKDAQADAKADRYAEKKDTKKANKVARFQAKKGLVDLINPLMLRSMSVGAPAAKEKWMPCVNGEV